MKHIHIPDEFKLEWQQQMLNQPPVSKPESKFSPMGKAIKPPVSNKGV